ncbi:hypothetical protein BS50DRAFT_380040 [Corynespora cassiicola Philippines]|uniref:Uncharacterized protein n=1 Tax=Corynespora cassiicola Philippines TaxID=1448308 RepID=A0A2T2NNH7_CORCC|nr:hypothetical protein BS50DRAFT_380040 [Corynespora cassiicola Philippines]
MQLQASQIRRLDATVVFFPSSHRSPAAPKKLLWRQSRAVAPQSKRVALFLGGSVSTSLSTQKTWRQAIPSRAQGRRSTSCRLEKKLRLRFAGFIFRAACLSLALFDALNNDVRLPHCRRLRPVLRQAPPCNCDAREYCPVTALLAAPKWTSCRRGLVVCGSPRIAASGSFLSHRTGFGFGCLSA